MMSKTKKIIIGLGAMSLVLGISGLFVSSANAYRGDPTTKGPNYTVERETAIDKAFTTNDYTAWSSLMANRGQVTRIINKNNFPRFVEAHNLAEKGDIVSAQKIRQELGLGLNNGAGRGFGRGNCMNY